MAQSDAPVPVRISVVIPTYNSRAFVGRAIQSALEQTVPPLEVVVVDDGSKDGTGELIAREFGNRVIYHYQENRGVSAARNAGIRLCSGDWIAFLDADDTWVPEKLELQVQELIANADAGMMACELFSWSPDTGECIPSRLPASLSSKDIRNHLKLRTLFVPGVMMVRRDIFEHVGTFDEELASGEDREFVARIAAAHYKIAVVRSALLRKTKVTSGVSWDPERIIRYGLIVNRRVSVLLRDHSLLGWWKDRMRLQSADASVWRSAAYIYMERQETLLAARHIGRSLRQWPFSPPGVYWLGLRLWARLLFGKAQWKERGR